MVACMAAAGLSLTINLAFIVVEAVPIVRAFAADAATQGASCCLCGGLVDPLLCSLALLELCCALVVPPRPLTAERH